jgi:MFS family permease
MLSSPTLWLMGQVRDPWALAGLSAIWCFWAGMSLALVNVLAGLFTAEGDRGKVFGLLALNTGLGALFGGLGVGPIAEHWGYPTLFAALALFGLLWPVVGLLLQDHKSQPATRHGARASRKAVPLGRDFYCLFLGSLAAALGAYVFIFGRSLVMARLGFGATAISATAALSEVPILPLPLLLGRLSDRFGRKPFLAFGYLAASGGLLGLAAGASAWHFWVSSISVTISFITGAVGTALVADVVTEEALSRGLCLFSATTWIAGTLGCAGAGCALQVLGPVCTCVASALLPLVAAALLFAIRRPGHGSRSDTVPPRVVPTAESLPATA